MQHPAWLGDLSQCEPTLLHLIFRVHDPRGRWGHAWQFLALGVWSPWQRLGALGRWLYLLRTVSVIPCVCDPSLTRPCSLFGMSAISPGEGCGMTEVEGKTGCSSRWGRGGMMRSPARSDQGPSHILLVSFLEGE